MGPVASLRHLVHSIGWDSGERERRRGQKNDENRLTALVNQYGASLFHVYITLWSYLHVAIVEPFNLRVTAYPQSKNHQDF